MDFCGVYCFFDVLWFDKVLKKCQGSVVLLGVILLWIVNCFDLLLVFVIFLMQLILCIELLEGEMWLINLFNGEMFDEYILEVWLKGNISLVVELFNEDLDEVDNVEVICKLLDMLKFLLMEEW